MARILVGIIIALVLVWAAYKGILYYYMDYVHPFPKVDDNHSNALLISDSIGFGMLAMCQKKHLYRNILKEAYKDSFILYGLTVNGATLSRNNPRSIMDYVNWEKAVNHKYQRVFIQLGTNDSKNDVWQGEDTFIKDLEEHLSKIRHRSPQCKIVLIGPPPIYKVHNQDVYNYDMNLDHLLTIERLLQNYAETHELEFVPMMEDSLNFKPYLKIDGVHPNKKGHQMIANQILKTIKIDE
ncbi:MAG: SGNH/GDSL hydrolase family protein [Erysipelothrix sp.]